MASIAVLPVLIGLAVDYAIQFQARFDEAVLAGPPSGRRRRPPRPEDRRSSPPASRPPWASSCCCSRRCRWCAASALLLVLGIAIALLVRDLRRVRRARSLLRAGARARSATRRGRRIGRHPRVHGGARVARRPLLAHARRGAPAPAPRARGGVGGGAAGARARHPERGRVGRARARAGGPPGARGRERAPGGDGRVRRDRRDRARRRHHRPGRGPLDEPLPGRRAARARLRAGQALRPGARRARALPGALPARPVPDRGRRAGAGGAAPRRGAALLLAGSGHGRPDHGQPRLRHPPDAARAPEGGGGRHQAPARPARWRGGVGGRAAGAGRRGERLAVVALAARAHAGGGPARRVPRPPRRAPLGRARRPCR